jgi:hypothetical protein
LFTINFKFVVNYFTRYYHADVGETYRKVKELIKEGDWNFDEFSELKYKLLKKLNIPEQDMLEQDMLLNQKLDNLKVDLQNSIKQQLDERIK